VPIPRRRHPDHDAVSISHPPFPPRFHRRPPPHVNLKRAHKDEGFNPSPFCLHASTTPPLLLYTALSLQNPLWCWPHLPKTQPHQRRLRLRLCTPLLVGTPTGRPDPSSNEPCRLTLTAVDNAAPVSLFLPTTPNWNPPCLSLPAGHHPTGIDRRRGRGKRILYFPLTGQKRRVGRAFS
jgi:hypothetical protein